MHIVDTLTCKYFAKSKPEQPGVYNKEACSLMDKRGNFEHKDCDFLMPLSTKFFDMRIKGNTQCTWDETFIVNELAANLLKPHIVLLFEILEVNTALIAQNSSLLTSEMFY